MSKPLLIMDQHFRQVEELFRPSAFLDLGALCDIHGGVNWPMARADFLARLPDADFVVAAQPALDREDLDRAPNLKAVIEVSGTFQTGLDYDACFERGIEVLSCAPGFQQSVAEMALGLMIAGGRGIVDEHERFRAGSERWFNDNIGTDFSLYGQRIGFVGFGSIAQECVRLLAPFPAKALDEAPQGWLLKPSDTAPAFQRQVELTPGKSITLTIRPHVLVPDADNARILAVQEPGFEASLGYAQSDTISAVLSDSIRKLNEDSRQIGNAIDELQQLIVSLPKPEIKPDSASSIPDAGTPIPEQP